MLYFNDCKGTAIPANNDYTIYGNINPFYGFPFRCSSL